MKAPATGEARVAQAVTSARSVARMFAPRDDINPAEYLDAFRLTEAEFEYVRKPGSTSLIKQCTRSMPDPLPQLGSLE